MFFTGLLTLMGIFDDEITFMEKQKNVFGEEIRECSCDPMTGYFRDGNCSTDESDIGSHTVCAQMTEEFLSYSFEQGNDLITPMREFGFPGLKHGDRWCLCAQRWVEAYENGKAPKLILESTHENVLDIVSMDILKKFALDLV